MISKPRSEIQTIKGEVRKEGLGWMASGGLIRREIKFSLYLFLVVGFMALAHGSRWEIIGWVLLALGTIWFVFVVATGIVFVSKQKDRQYKTMARRLLSKEYWNG